MRSDLAEARRLDRPGFVGRSGALRLLILAEHLRLLTPLRLATARAAHMAGYDVFVAAPAEPGGDARARAEIEAAGLAFWEIPALAPRVGALGELRLIGLFGEMIDALRPDLVHCIGLKPVIYAGAAARLRRLPTVLAIPGFGAAQSGEGAKAALRRFLLRRCLAIAARNPRAAVVVQCASDRTQALAPRALHPRRAFFIRGAAADLTRFHPRARDERPPGPPVVVFASERLGSAEVHSFAAAAALVHAKGMEGRFAVLGEPDADEAGAAGAEELAAYQEAGLIEWWGQPADHAPRLRQADIFCFPASRQDEVPQPLVEAVASGLPTVAIDGPGNRQAVRHGANGLLVPPGEAQALAAALERLMSDTDFRLGAGERAREIAEAEFSLDAFLTASLAVYRSALGKAADLLGARQSIERGPAP